MHQLLPLFPQETHLPSPFRCKECLSTSTNQGLIYLNNSLGNRLTFCEWSKTLMGPILDRLGVEQGGVNSDKLYMLANNDQLWVVQLSELGIDLGTSSSVISCIRQSDDSALVANDIICLQNLLILTLEYCQRYNVTLVPEKTKLLVFSPPGQEEFVEYWKIVSPINIC